MRHLLRSTAAVLALMAGVAAPPRLAAEDPPPTPAAGPGTEEPAALKRAAALDEQILRLWGAGDSKGAEPLAREALALREQVLGREHPDVAASLLNLSAQLERQARYAEARTLCERAVAILETSRGKDHPDVATGLNNLATILKAQGHYADARPLLERALATREKALGKDHPKVATSLLNLAGVLRAQGDYDEARPLFERALAIGEGALGRDHPDVATMLLNFAGLLRAQGDYAQARVLLERALRIHEVALGADHPDVASTLNSLGLLHAELGDFAAAMLAYERGLSIRERVLGRAHPAVATSLNNLAGLLMAQGAYAAARPRLERALAIHEQTLGSEHPDVVSSILNLAGLFRAQGSHVEAQALETRALSIGERVLGKDHPRVAMALNNLAETLHARGEHAQARPLYERAISIFERTLGGDHPLIADGLGNLAVLLKAQGALAEARPLYERALKIQEGAFGADHPSVATGLGNLALLLAAQGDLAAARPLQERALAIRTRAFGSGHPDVAASLSGLAGLLTAQGAHAEARRLHERALALVEAHARGQLAGLSPTQRLVFVRSIRWHLDAWLRFAPRVGVSGHAEVLRLRGLATRAETAERILTRRASDEERRIQGSLLAVQRRASRLAHEMPPAANASARGIWQRRYAEVTAERERLTLELSGRSAALRGALERLDLGLAHVQGRLRSDAALVDLLRVGDRYLAWIVRGRGEPVRADLGAAEAIEDACAAFVKAVEEEAAQERAATGARLRDLVWVPVEAHLGPDVTRVVLCPDAALAAVPFAALPGRGADRHLLDELTLAYVGMAQDLVPWEEARSGGSGALVVGGVDYERAQPALHGETAGADPLALALPEHAPRGPRFAGIPQTRVEAESLHARLGEDRATLLMGPEATEARVRTAVKGKRLLHVATHGFAREDLLAGLRRRDVKDEWLSAGTERQLSVGHDPMLLSGLALAGANPREGGDGDDGILTALEASYLDLDGVELVTLSACETAKGTAESGEGVLGLVSAFQMAGARHVLASLWKVDDEATRLLMEGVYERLLRKESPLSPADALREAALALRDRKDADGQRRFAAPRYWAAFVAYGG